MIPKSCKNCNAFLLLLFLIKNSVCIISETGFGNDKRDIQERIAHCVKKATENLFLSSYNLHLIADKNLIDKDFYRTIYQFFSFTIENTTLLGSNEKSYIIIENNILNLKKKFDGTSFSKLSDYLFLTKTSTEYLSEFATYLYRSEYYDVAFLRINENGDITLNQFDFRLKNKNNETDNHEYLMRTAYCNDNLLVNENSSKKVRSFHEIVCPIKGCTLSFWRLRLDAPKSVYYKTEINGSIIANSYAARILHEFANKFEIQVTTKLNESDFPMDWDEATNAAVEGKVNILYGFTFPEAKFIERMEISTSYMYVL